MITFDAYVPTTWLDNDGIFLIVTPKKKVRQKIIRARSFRFVAAAASAFAIGMALIDVPIFVRGYAVGDRVELSKAAVLTARMPDDVSPGYWPKLVSLVRNSPSLPDDNTNGEPPPLA